MVQYLEKYKQNIAIDMRKRGMSYSEIQNRLNIPKSTLSFWLTKIKLTEDQKNHLLENRIEGAKKGSIKKTRRTLEAIRKIKISAAEDIKEVLKRELWLMGVVLYWRERNDDDLKKGIHFASSDPALIKFFLKWLKDIGGIKDDEIMFDIFISKNEHLEKKQRRILAMDAISHWSKVTGFPKDTFSRFYLQKTKARRKRGGRTISKKSPHGFLRVRVKASSMLARQIDGWIKGLQDNLL